MKSILIVAFLFASLLSCTKPNSSNSGGDTPLECVGPAKSFTTDVRPLIQNTCATAISCHGAGSTTGPGPLLTYAQIFNVRATIRSEVSSGHMPPGGGISNIDKNVIICWINSGAPNN